MSRNVSGIAHAHGVVETIDRTVSYFRGPSKIKHTFDPKCEADRRAAQLGAQSQFGPLPSGVVLSITASGSLCLTVKGKDFILLTDHPWSYTNVRKQISEHLKQLRSKPVGNRSNSPRQEYGELHG
jgi:hypothetical protein